MLLFIGIGWGFINPANHTPFIPAPTTYTTPQGITHHYGGILGILGAAGCFLRLHRVRRGLDRRAGSEKSEARHADRDSRLARLLHHSLRAFLLRAERYRHRGRFRTAGREASVAFAISKYMTGYEWLSQVVTVAILAGFSSVILVMLFGQSRVFFSMSRDGLVPQFSPTCIRVIARPGNRTCCSSSSPALLAALSRRVTGEMTSIGTLFAFILVCIGVWIIRVRRPNWNGDSASRRPLVSTSESSPAPR